MYMYEHVHEHETAPPSGNAPGSVHGYVRVWVVVGALVVALGLGGALVVALGGALVVAVVAVGVRVVVVGVLVVAVRLILVRLHLPRLLLDGDDGNRGPVPASDGARPGCALYGGGL